MEPSPRSSSWGNPRVSPFVQLAICTFGILVLELAIIRWMSSQIRIVAYFSNVVLLASFLGMGLGVALGRRHPALVNCCLPALAGLSLLLAFSRPIGLMNLSFPDPSLSLWGADSPTTLWGFAGATMLVGSIFWAVVAVFVFASTPIGWLFDQMPTLSAYSADLLGSLLGVVTMTAAAAFGMPPVVWFALGTLPLLWFSRRLLSWMTALLTMVLAGLSQEGAIFSPYNRIDLAPMEYLEAGIQKNQARQEWNLSVNRDFHQYLHDFSRQTVDAEPAVSSRRRCQQIYDLPFRIASRKDAALVVGAGTGNDVMAALRQDFHSVLSVEIDPAILRVGEQFHPERPYSDLRAIPVINDARAYFEQNPGSRFDVICYGLLDSHAMFSAMSSLRLDNFVYTVEGVRAGWRQVKEDGILSLSFSVYAGRWMAERMLGIIREATGLSPIVVPHGLNYGITYLVGRHLRPEAVAAITPKLIVDPTPNPAIRIPTDDWPFLYLRPGSIPYAYLSVLLVIVVTSALAIRRVYGREMFTGRRFDVPLFLMGAAFMLLETRMVTELSLLFGSTWVVNSVVFAGILLMVLLANWVTGRWKIDDPQKYYLPLAICLLATWFTGAGILNRFSLLERGLIGGLIYALPIAFAGLIFSSLLRRSKDPAAALGANLLGAVLGGVLEYSSMVVGLRAMALLALSFYLASYVVAFRWSPRLDSPSGRDESSSTLDLPPGTSATLSP